MGRLIEQLPIGKRLLWQEIRKVLIISSLIDPLDYLNKMHSCCRKHYLELEQPHIWHKVMLSMFLQKSWRLNTFCHSWLLLTVTWWLCMHPWHIQIQQQDIVVFSTICYLLWPPHSTTPLWLDLLWPLSMEGTSAVIQLVVSCGQVNAKSESQHQRPI